MIGISWKKKRNWDNIALRCPVPTLRFSLELWVLITTKLSQKHKLNTLINICVVSTVPPEAAHLCHWCCLWVLAIATIRRSICWCATYHVKRWGASSQVFWLPVEMQKSWVRSLIHYKICLLINTAVIELQGKTLGRDQGNMYLMLTYFILFIYKSPDKRINVPTKRSWYLANQSSVILY